MEVADRVEESLHADDGVAGLLGGVEGGLARQYQGEGAGGVHVGAGEQAELFELVGGEEVGFVDDEDNLSASFGDFGGEGVLGLGDETAAVEAGHAAEPGDDGGVQAS